MSGRAGFGRGGSNAPLEVLALAALRVLRHDRLHAALNYRSNLERSFRTAPSDSRSESSSKKCTTGRVISQRSSRLGAVRTYRLMKGDRIVAK